MKRVDFIRCSGAALTLVLGACSFAPPLKTPQIPTADAYKELGPWTQAQPADRLPRDSWWRLYENTELDGLEKRLIDGNPTLAAALANYAQAKAVSDQARAGLFPTVGLNGSVGRARESVNAPLISRLTPRYYDDNVLSGSVSYELDLWGQIRNEVAEGEANAAASAADLENARLSLIAQLVDDYIQLRNLDHESDLLDQTVKAYSRALGLTEQRHNAGIAPGLDVSQAQIGSKFQGLRHVGFGRGDLALLQQRSRHVDPAIGIARLGLSDLLKGVLRALKIALQEQSDSPIVPALAIFGAHYRGPCRTAHRHADFGVRQDFDGQFRNLAADLARNVGGNTGGIERIFQPVVIAPYERWILTGLGRPAYAKCV